MFQELKISEVPVEVARDPIDSDNGELFWLYADELLHENATDKEKFEYSYESNLLPKLLKFCNFIYLINKLI